MTEHILRHLLFTLLLTLLLQASTVHSKIVGAAVIPHGDFSYDPTLLPLNSKSRAAANIVHEAALSLHSFVTDIKPDVIFLSTPHGMELTNNFVAYLNTNGTGFAAIGQDLHNASIPPRDVPLVPSPINLAPNLTLALVERLVSLKQNVSGIKNFADSEPAALRWGEVVPLLFVPLQVRQKVKTIVWSQPLRRYKESKAMVPELLEVGRLVAEYLEDLEERVLVLVSSDLAHTHLESGPYGYSNASEPFDQAIGRWLENPKKDAESLLVTARNLEDRALSCGFTG